MNNNDYKTENKIVLFGPYIGDWKEEIFSFRPFIKWIYNNIEFKDYYIATHFNRSFLYNFIEPNNFFSIYESLTRDELKQENAIHKDIETKEYSSIILKNIREEIAQSTSTLKKNIVHYGLSYIKSTPNFSVLNKTFDKIDYTIDKEKNKIIFIPDMSGNKKVLETILNHLEKNYKDEYYVIGDNKTYFQDENVIHKRIDYLEIVYQFIIDYISNAEIVICPCSHWTLLANQQNSYVFSWGHKNLSHFKTKGAYGFNNDNYIVEINKGIIDKQITKNIDHVINYVRRNKDV